jgi:ligand-binding sensor domain-containing protein
VNLARSHVRRLGPGSARGRGLWFRAAALALALGMLVHGQRAVYDLYGVERGLTNLSITAWAQDRRGFVWVGTEQGLFRFDGSQFRRYGEEDGAAARTRDGGLG